METVSSRSQLERERELGRGKERERRRIQERERGEPVLPIVALAHKRGKNALFS